jgi:hypothetical protein
MSAMAHDARPAPDQPASGFSLPRWLIWLMLPGMIGPIFIVGFLVWTEARHDPSRCPFHERERRSLAPDVTVVEEARNCVGSVEEHRYRLLRRAQERLLGERRFDRAEWSGDRYEWKASISDKGQVYVTVHNAGHEDMLFREGTAAEHEKDARDSAGR